MGGTRKQENVDQGNLRVPQLQEEREVTDNGFAFWVNSCPIPTSRNTQKISQADGWLGWDEPGFANSLLYCPQAPLGEGGLPQEHPLPAPTSLEGALREVPCLPLLPPAHTEHQSVP